MDPEGIQEHAAAAVATPSTSLPFLSRIQRAFREHDLSGVRAHTGADAAAGAEAIAARAFTRGEDVVFDGAPDLHTAAHEAAHVVQQRAGVPLPHGVGREGDAHERQADAAANAVIANRAAEPLLPSPAPRPSRGVQRATVKNSPRLQQLFEKLNKDPNVQTMIANAEELIGGEIKIRVAANAVTRWNRGNETIYVAIANRSDDAITESLLFELANAANPHTFTNAIEAKLLKASEAGKDLSFANFRHAATEMEKDEFSSVVDYRGIVENLDATTGLARNPLRRKYRDFLEEGSLSYARYVEQNELDHTDSLANDQFDNYYRGTAVSTKPKAGTDTVDPELRTGLPPFDPSTIAPRFVTPPTTLAPDDLPEPKPGRSKKRKYESEESGDSDSDYVEPKRKKTKGRGKQ